MYSSFTWRKAYTRPLTSTLAHQSNFHPWLTTRHDSEHACTYENTIDTDLTNQKPQAPGKPAGAPSLRLENTVNSVSLSSKLGSIVVVLSPTVSVHPSVSLHVCLSVCPPLSHTHTHTHTHSDHTTSAEREVNRTVQNETSGDLNIRNREKEEAADRCREEPGGSGRLCVVRSPGPCPGPRPAHVSKHAHDANFTITSRWFT